MKNTVILNNLRFYSYHGVLSQEKSVGHKFVVSMRIDTDFKNAIRYDSVKDTVDYGIVVDIVKEQMTQRSKLMEHVAGRILKVLFNRFDSIQRIKIVLVKENPPVNSDCDACGVELDVTRDDFFDL